MPEVVIPIRTDAAKAQEIRDAVKPLLEQVCVHLNQARRDGLIFNCNLDQYGLHRPDIGIVKPI